ncbi:transcriptional regulator GcvA [Ruegeria arenilitoris]|uniref:transcriptional regulator GcvA n=1 Tax=Ruegeria arenilitoris TaxID=1173585 RepID=UPI00147A8788|nr:transcriptional regulator GcvA [Ruegeria arenilitoris]
MSDRLPPLTALRAFDAAARHMSFAKAAEELHVTPAALSFQIKSLEEHLGHPLFRRMNRAVELTEAGKTLAPGAAEGFVTLQTAWQATRRLQDTTSLTVTAGPALTAKWLAPRLYDFARAYPEIDLKFSATLRNMDLHRDDVDIAIRFGYGDDEDLYSVPVRQEWLTPVMTPELAEKFATAQSLRDAPLIHDDSIGFLDPPCDWPAWFRAVGIDFTPRHGAHFSNADHAIDAAVAGVGIALGRRAMIIKDLSEGRLVAPFKTAIETQARFRFLCLPGAETRPQISAFRDWFLSEIEKTAHISDDFEIIPVEKVAIK